MFLPLYKYKNLFIHSQFSSDLSFRKLYKFHMYFFFGTFTWNHSTSSKWQTFYFAIFLKSQGVFVVKFSTVRWTSSVLFLVHQINKNISAIVFFSRHLKFHIMINFQSTGPWKFVPCLMDPFVSDPFWSHDDWTRCMSAKKNKRMRKRRNRCFQWATQWHELTIFHTLSSSFYASLHSSDNSKSFFIYLVL